MDAYAFDTVIAVCFVLLGLFLVAVIVRAVQEVRGQGASGDRDEA